MKGKFISIINKIKKIDGFDISIFIIIILILGYAGYVFYPGIMTADSIDQWNQARNNVYSDIHSVMHTYIEHLLIKIWNNTEIVVIFQIFTFALIWTIICRYTRCNKKSIGIFQILFTIIICIFPINFIYSVTLWKDILYSYFLLLIMYYIFIGINNKFQYSNMQIIGIAINLILILGIRHNRNCC